MFKRISNLIKGFLGMFIGGLEKKNPEALLEVEKENLRSQIAEYNKGLASHAGLCERLMSQVKKLTKEAEQLRAKAAANLKAGNKKQAGQYALQLKSTNDELTDNSSQLEEAEKTYKELLEARDVSVKAARTKINELKRGIDDMKVKNAMAELNEMAAGMVTEIGGSGDTLDRLHDMVEDERTKAAGRARVARDSMDTSGVDVLQSEQEAMEEQALADFAAMEGLAVEGGSGDSDGGGESEDGTKSMGPSETA